ncbi:N-acetyl-L,L-diaminopimelate deacetylase [Streptococcus oralis]|uniref:N-acetyl-L,L-diaminopimelate deacetylase n=1 Tax=Streptococcus oralis TaxID=1303 RepID=A0A139RP99_STROR|nr:amidohydrolase [Streptococcus oralis]KXU16570.1 N-acetyl-L,L-diaminopimelate deacetylase [Streptococcus oralis]
MSISQSQLEEEFFWFHSHPELSFQEVETTKKLKELLEKEGIRVLDLPLKTGLVAVIEGGKPGKTIALRSDIDALPIVEATSLNYQSQNLGVMHACGHDFHLTSLYGAAIALHEIRKDIKGIVKLIFQPAEEIFSGATHILETGILEDVEEIYGIHCNPSFEVGTVAIGAGNVTAAVDRFRIQIKGSGTHAAHPDEGIDPIVATSQLISALQTIISRNINPFSTSLISVTHVEAGTTWNVIPEDAFIEGTVRTLDASDRAFIKKRIYEVSEYCGKAFNTTVEIDWIAGPPATNNDFELTNFAREIAEKNEFTVVSPLDNLGGEDFAFYQEKIKGVFVLIGTDNSHPLHHPQFKVNPKALLSTANLLKELAQSSLERLSERGS